MTRADLALAVERLATSKIDDEDLLASARWLRGEACPRSARWRARDHLAHAREPHA